MKKKQLNRQQLWRIQKMQDEYAKRARQRESATEAELKLDLSGPERRGLVISHFGQQLDIEARDGENAGEIVRCFQRSNLEPLVTGDEVIWQAGEPMGVVTSNLPRKSVLKRPTGMGELKPVAANIENIFIVIAPIPLAHYNLIDRYLVAAAAINLDATIVLNKCDLLEDPAFAEAAERTAEMLQLYEQIGHPTLVVSSKSEQGLLSLKNKLAEHTSIFVGQSGVGKSALVNALLPGVNTLEGSLSDVNDSGRHTTTSARLFHFPDGGDLIDSPGIREFGLGHIEPDELISGFHEFRPFLGGCKFRDCKHETEPGCRLLQATEEGHISERRLESYRQILDSVQAN